ncbi:TetR/AcrR family transcriptional regulator [Oxalobacteraceae bacterium A2-2]
MDKERGRPRADSGRDLRTELLDTSRALLNEGGVAALSMREVARRAGCTHQAPYHYFADRETILAALAADGFGRLAGQLRAANELAASAGVRAALRASAQAYVAYALDQPGVFRLMFRPDECNPARFPGVVEAGARARAELDRLNTLVHGERATPAHASILWAHVHGLACLLMDGPLAAGLAAAQAREQHLEQVAQHFADLLLGAAQA